MSFQIAAVAGSAILGAGSSYLAGKKQKQAADAAIQQTDAQYRQTREDLLPFTDAGQDQLKAIESGIKGLAGKASAKNAVAARQMPAAEKDVNALDMLTTSPAAQRDFIEKSPFYQGFAEDASRELTAQNASLGKFGSGGTSEELQRRLLTYGSDLLNQNLQQRTQSATARQGIAETAGNLMTQDVNRAQVPLQDRLQLATLGENAATGTGAAGMKTAEQVNTILGNKGNVQGSMIAGITGALTPTPQTLDNFLYGDNSTTAGRAGSKVGQFLAKLSDARFKRDAKQIGVLRDGLPVYKFRYLDDDAWHMGVMAHEAEQMRPDAVLDVSGVKYVNYGAF